MGSCGVFQQNKTHNNGYDTNGGYNCSYNHSHNDDDDSPTRSLASMVEDKGEQKETLNFIVYVTLSRMCACVCRGGD